MICSVRNLYNKSVSVSTIKNGTCYEYSQQGIVNSREKTSNSNKTELSLGDF